MIKLKKYAKTGDGFYAERSEKMGGVPKSSRDAVLTEKALLPWKIQGGRIKNAKGQTVADIRYASQMGAIIVATMNEHWEAQS